MFSTPINTLFIGTSLALLCASFVNGDIPNLTLAIGSPKDTSVPECNETNWSAGNAFFTIVALCFGFYGYSRGCLVVPSSGRTWRLSPILVLEELIFGIFLFWRAVKAEISTIVVCFALLPFVPPRPLLDRNIEGMIVYNSVHQIDGFRDDETLSDTEGRLERHRHESAARIQAQIIVEGRRKSYNIDLSKRILHKLKDLDRGPSYRIFIWIPMWLQFSKLVAVLVLSKRVAWLVLKSGFVYFFAWLVLELVTYKASKNSLSEDEIEVAAQLRHEWVVQFSTFRGENKFRSEISSTIAYGVPSLTIVTLPNIGLVGKFTHDLVPIPQIGWILAGTSMMLVFFYFAQYPVLLRLLKMIATRMWRSFGGERRYAKLWEEIPDYDVASYYTASAALHGAGLAIWAFAGIYPWNNAFSFSVKLILHQHGYNFRNGPYQHCCRLDTRGCRKGSRQWNDGLCLSSIARE